MADSPRPAPVLFVHHGQNWIRGSERCLLDLVERLDRARFRPVVWCDAEALAGEARALGAEVHHASTVGREDDLGPVDRVKAREAVAVLRRYEARLVHANDLSPLPGLVLAARRLRVPLVAHIHLIPEPVDRRWLLLHQVNLAIGVSRASVAGLLADGMPADRVTVIYNGVDTRRLALGGAPGLRAQLGIPRDAIVLVAVASLIARKGLDVAIRALACARERGRDLHLLLCGDGPEEGALRALAAELGVAPVVHFLGVRGDVGAVLRDAADVLVSAARLEAFPLNLLEAGGCSLPAVVSDIAPHTEAIVDGETGLVVATDDPPAFAAAIERLASDPALRRRMGEAARRRVLANFELTRWIAEFERTYAALLTRPARDFGWLGASTWPPVYTRWVREFVARRLS